MKFGSSKRLLLAAAAVLAVLGAGWFYWTKNTAPEPPEIPSDKAEPAVVRSLQAAREQVVNNPYSAAAWGKLGKLLRAYDLIEPALTCFAQAEKLSKGEARWPYLRGEGLVQLGRAAEAVPHLERAVVLGVQNKEELLSPRLRWAEALLASANYLQAEEALLVALEESPDHPSLHLNLGLAAVAHEDFPKARSHFERCLHSPFTQQKAARHLAAVLLRLGDKTGAEQQLRRAQALPADYNWSDPWLMECLRLGAGKDARFRLIEHLEAQGQTREAIEILKELADESGDFRAWLGLGKNLIDVGQLEEAEEALRAALKAVPDNVLATYLLSKLFYARGEQLWAKKSPEAKAAFRSAVAAARAALVHKPDHALAWLIIGLCLERLGEKEEAMAALRQSVACGPDLPDAALHLGKLLTAKGEWREARSLLDHAARMARPDDPRPKAALAELQEKQKKGQ